MTVTKEQMAGMKQCVANGYSVKGAGAIVGNFSWESGSPHLPARFKAVTDHGSQGIGQWRLDRLSGLERFAEARGLNPADGIAQFNYAFWELENLPRRSMKWLNAQLKNPGTRSIANLTANFSEYFEKPAKKYEHLDERIAYAESCVKAFQPETKPGTGEVIGAGGAVAGSAGTAMWIWSQGITGPILAIFVTLTIAAVILSITILVQKAKAPAAIKTASAHASAATPMEELRRAIEECKTSHEALDAAEAVFLMHVKEIEALKNELEQLRKSK